MSDYTPTWDCGDCGAEYNMSIPYCTRPFDDYLSLRGGSVESAIRLAVEAGQRGMLLKSKTIGVEHGFAIAA